MRHACRPQEHASIHANGRLANAGGEADKRAPYGEAVAPLALEPFGRLGPAALQLLAGLHKESADYGRLRPGTGPAAARPYTASEVRGAPLGVVEFEALERSLLVLERGYTPAAGSAIRLFEAAWDGRPLGSRRGPGRPCPRLAVPWRGRDRPRWGAGGPPRPAAHHVSSMMLRQGLQEPRPSSWLPSCEGWTP